MAKGTKKQEAQPQSGNGLKRLEERLLKVSRSTNFPTYVRVHFDRLSQILESGPRGAVKWEELAKWAVDEGLTDGNPLKPATAKRTYEREVERRKKREAERTDKPKAQPIIAPIAAQIFEPIKEAPKQPPTPDDAEARMQKLRRKMDERSGR